MPLHTAFATALDRRFAVPGHGRSLWRMVEDRAPIDLLIYLALAAFVVGLHAAARARAEAERATALEGALAAARPRRRAHLARRG